MPFVLLNKPFRVLCQFSDDQGRDTLADWLELPGVYPAGRLDFDSEGLVILTDDGALKARISEPRHKLEKHYWAQVDGSVASAQLDRLVNGVVLKDGPAKAVSAAHIEEPPGLWTRHPPIRYRKSLPTSWIDIVLDEGRNRQVRRMTAAVGLPTLRLVRYRIGPWTLGDLRPGASRVVDTAAAWRQLQAYR